MEWIDITIEVPRQWAQPAADIATGISGSGLYIEDYADIEEQVEAIAHINLIEQELLDKPRNVVKIHLYLPAGGNVAEVQELLHSRLLAVGAEYTLASESVQQEDWETSWKKYYHPIEIGTRLAIAPTWEDYTSSRTVIRLDPGMAFGTGTHETTALCLSVLDERVQGGERMLDIGTGSGILAVGALMLGAREALGVDIDPMCVRTANENAARNGVEGSFTAAAGDLAAMASGTYDIITANIVADAIIRLAPDVLPLLAPEGFFVASGILQERAQEVKTELEKAGLHMQEIKQAGGWVALVLTHKTAG